MNDPYSVLGVSPSASDEEIKKVYRDLARKYHPDNYQDNPLADLAQEKMKAINEAYDTITRARAGGASQSSQSYSQSYGQQSYADQSTASNATYNQIRQAINAGNLTLAEQLLASIPTRDAEWYFLNGAVAYLHESGKSRVPPGHADGPLQRRRLLPPGQLSERLRRL